MLASCRKKKEEGCVRESEKVVDVREGPVVLFPAEYVVAPWR